MRKFACPHCHRRVFFENVVCENCGQQLAFDAHIGAALALSRDNRSTFDDYRHTNLLLLDDLVVGLGPAIAVKLPHFSDLLDFSEIEVGDQQLVVVL